MVFKFANSKLYSLFSKNAMGIIMMLVIETSLEKLLNYSFQLDLTQLKK